MITLKRLGLALALGVLAQAATAAAPADPLAGRWAFNWLIDPNKTRCAKVEGKLLSQLRAKGVKCDLTEQVNSSTSHAFVSCKRAHPAAEWMIFKTRALCEDERKMQAANGD
jgi:hypothetical protein